MQSIAQTDAASEQRSGNTLADPAPWLLELFGSAPSLAGVTVSPSTAMRSPAVRAAVEAIAEAIGGLPLFIYQRNGEARSRAPEHPAYALLHDDANEWTPATTFREQITRDALLWGNGYAFINRYRDDKPIELIRLQPSAVTVELDRITSEPTYRLSDGTRQRVYDRREILHIAAPSIDGVSGASPVMQCREAIAVNMAIEKHVARLFANQARPSGILSFARSLTAEAAAKMKASWQAMTSSGGTAVLDADAKYEQITLSSADAQTLELWQHSVIEICRAFRVPPHLVFELGRATWGNAGEMGATFLRFTLDRWIKAWQGEVRLKLIAPEDRGTFYAEFLTDDLLRSDLAARAEAYTKLIAARVLNPNEARARENLAPYEGGNEFANPHITMSTAPAKTEGKTDE
ncbi:phage portal protein [Phyllobacterium phragmitis]|uniref:phage portal protein n=1 Tax=Phyllobacterium phragmitis TaxID=2670329 RepID=UPI0038B2530E